MDIDWYFIGLWLGDGASDAVSITSADREIIDYLYTLSEKHHLHFIVTPTKSKAMEINLGGQPSTQSVQKYTLDGKFIEQYSSIKEAAFYNDIRYPSNISHAASETYKSCGGFMWKYSEKIIYNPLLKVLKYLNIYKNKHIPSKIFSETEFNKKEFLAGLIDSDGTCNYQTISISQKSKKFLVDTLKLCKSLGYLGRIKQDCIKGKMYYKLILKGDLRDISIRLSRKRPTKISRIPKAMNEYYGC